MDTLMAEPFVKTMVMMNKLNETLKLVYNQNHHSWNLTWKARRK